MFKRRTNSPTKHGRLGSPHLLPLAQEAVALDRVAVARHEWQLAVQGDAAVRLGRHAVIRVVVAHLQ